MLHSGQLLPPWHAPHLMLSPCSWLFMNLHTELALAHIAAGKAELKTQQRLIAPDLDAIAVKERSCCGSAGEDQLQAASCSAHKQRW